MNIENITVIKKKAAVVVVIDNFFNYKRYVGKILTNHIITNEPLNKGDLEGFRLHPASFIKMYQLNHED